MQSFTDTEGRAWEVRVTTWTVERCRNLLDVDLCDVASLAPRLMDDPVLLAKVIYVACKPQADAAGVTDEQFTNALYGDVIDDATNAMIEAIIDFFQKSRRDLMRQAWQKCREKQEKGEKMVAELLNSPVVDEMIETHLKKLGDSFGNALASSASTPAPSP